MQFICIYDTLFMGRRKQKCMHSLNGLVNVFNLSFAFDNTLKRENIIRLKKMFFGDYYLQKTEFKEMNYF